MWISFIFSVVSLLISLTSVYILVKFSKPRIKLYVINQDPYCKCLDKNIYRNFFITSGSDKYAIINVEILNESDKAGTIYDIFLVYKNITCHGEAIYKNYPKMDLMLKVENQDGTASYNEEYQNLKQPILVKPFSYSIGFIRFPYFYIETENIIEATLEYKVAGFDSVYTKKVKLAPTHFVKTHQSHKE